MATQFIAAGLRLGEPGIVAVLKSVLKSMPCVLPRLVST